MSDHEISSYERDFGTEALTNQTQLKWSPGMTTEVLPDWQVISSAKNYDQICMGIRNQPNCFSNAEELCNDLIETEAAIQNDHTSFGSGGGSFGGSGYDEEDSEQGSPMMNPEV